MEDFSAAASACTALFKLAIIRRYELVTDEELAALTLATREAMAFLLGIGKGKE